jgi:ABC-2 type transport system permease protein
MSTYRLVAAYVSETKFESLRLLRSPAFSIPILVMPIFMYLFFGILVAGARGPAIDANWMFVGWTVYAIMGPGLFGFGVLVAVERNQGLLTLKRALPMPPAAYLVAKIAMALLFAAGVLTTLVAVGVSMGHVSLRPVQLVVVAAVMSLAVVPACAIGLFIGAWAPASSAPAIANIAYISMAFFGGLFFQLPAGLRALQPLWPTYHLAQLALASAGLPSEGAVWTHALTLACVTVGLTALATWRLARPD